VTSRLNRLIVAIAVMGALGSGCSSSHGSAATSGGTVALAPAGNTKATLPKATLPHVTLPPHATLMATAVAWAHAFLVGSLDDIRALQGPECADRGGATVPIGTVNQYLSGERAVMQKYLGRPLDKINIRRVVVRNVTRATGEALVEYDLPTSLSGGNDNWVTYTIHAGRWKVSDCHAPIGGSSSSASGTVTAPTP
jgi:hypothetical protein